MITEIEKREILLAEWKQKKAEEDFYLNQRKKAIKKTLMMMEEEDERDITGYECSVYETEMDG